MDDDSKRKLEQAINHYSLEDVLATLAEICLEQAEHHAMNGYNTTSAKVWHAQAASILHCASCAQRRRL